MMKSTFIPILLIALIPAAAVATLISTTMSADTLTAGDRVELGVGIVVAKGMQVTPPPVEGGIGGFIVKDWFTTRTEQNKTDSITYKYLLTNYTIGLCTIPELPFLIVHDGTIDTIKSRLIPMRVGSVIPPGTDTVDIKDLKPQQITGKPSLLWLWLLLAVIAAVTATLGIRRWFEKCKKAPPLPPPPPPYEEAIKALEQLDAKQLVMKGMIREYVFELSEIFKRYLGRRFESNAAEFTTEEMLRWLRTSGMTNEPRVSAEWFFDATDPVKFARIIPDSGTIERFGTEARSVIEATRPVIQPGQPQQPPQAAQSPGVTA